VGGVGRGDEEAGGGAEETNRRDRVLLFDVVPPYDSDDQIVESLGASFTENILLSSEPLGGGFRLRRRWRSKPRRRRART